MGSFTLVDKKRNLIRVLNGQSDMISNLSRPMQKTNVHIIITESRFLRKILFYVEWLGLIHVVLEYEGTSIDYDNIWVYTLCTCC